MKKRLPRVLLGVAAGLGILIGGVWLLSRALENNHETLYQGKPSHYWLEQLDSRDATASNQVMVILNQQIIPRLTDEMFHDTNDSNFKLALVENLNQLPGVTIGFIPAGDRREGSADELGGFGPAAKAAIPGLIQAVNGNDKFSRCLAITVLGDIHGEPEVVIPLLLPYLEDGDADISAAQALGKFGGLARAAVPKLIPMLKLNDPKDREIVQAALKNIDPEAAKQAGIR